MRPKRKLQTKVAIPLLVAGITLFVLSIAIAYYSFQKSSRAENERRAEELTLALRNLAEIAGGKTSFLQRSIQELAKSRDIDLALVAFGDPYSVVASSKRTFNASEVKLLNDPVFPSDVAAAFSRIQNDTHIVTIGNRLYFGEAFTLYGRREDGQPIKGLALLAFDNTSIIALQNRHFKGIALLLIAAALLVTVLGYTQLTRHVFIPLADLKDAIEARRAGDKSRLAKSNGDDEIGEIADQYNALIVDLDQRSLELEESEERFQIAAEGSSVGIWDWIDVNNDAQWWSTRFFDLLGYEIGEISASRKAFTEQLLHPEDAERTNDAFDQCFKAKNAFRIDFRLKTKSGEYRWFLGSGTISRDSNGNPARMTGSIQDIHNRKLAEEELHTANSQLHLANKELSSYAYITSHDLQEPLRSIASFLQLLKLEYGEKLDEDANEYIDFAVTGATRLQGMIRSLLKYSRIDSNTKLLNRLELTEPIALAQQNLKVLIEETGAEIEISELPSIFGDLSQLTQLFQNLIGNSIKFRSEASPRILITSKMVTGNQLQDPFPKNLKYCLVSVKDNGIGINPDYHERIFSIFQRLHSDTKYEGHGIGLALCGKIVNRHYGKIWVDSEEGHGSSFSFNLPMQPMGTAQ